VAQKKKTEWTPFQRADAPPFTKEELLAQGYPLEQVEHVLKELASAEYYLNNIYQVAVNPTRKISEDAPQFVHLSIKRIDKHPVRDWRHLQRIKNEIIGPEHEGIEIFPAESRLADMANQYHLWVLMDPEERIPTGFFDGRMVGNVAMEGGKQRPHEEGTHLTREGSKDL